MEVHGLKNILRGNLNMKPKEKNLWTRDFTCITIATILSAVRGEAMNLPVSLLVFEETGSTLLSALVLICGMLPDVFFSVLAAPLIDKGGKKKWIVGLDILTAVTYLGMGLWVAEHDFDLVLYLIFVLIIGSISVLYRLAYGAWYPALIPEGLEQKGYAVSNSIYPVVIIAAAPFSTFLYERISMAEIFHLVTGITLLSVTVECCIREGTTANTEKYTWKVYLRDIREGFSYIKREKGIQNIYAYMSITNGISDGNAILTQAFYQTSPHLTVTMLGFLKSAEMIGRGMGGIFQYRKEIPVKKRYAFTKMVYGCYNVMDLLLLFLPYPFMVLNRFICGALGVSSATIRETSVQCYLPENMRARVNAFFNMAFAAGSVAFQFVAGLMGQVMSYRAAVVILAVFTLICMEVLIVLPAKQNRPVYEATRR